MIKKYVKMCKKKSVFSKILITFVALKMTIK